MSVVFQCPSCSSSFRVAPEHAGKLVGCPSCQQSVKVPENLSSSNPSDVHSSSHEILNCPKCNGEFRVAPELSNSKVACPHCNATVQPKKPGKQPINSDLFAPGHQSSMQTPEPEFKIRTGKTKKPKKKTPIIAPPQPKENVPAPASEQLQTPAPQTPPSLPTPSVAPKRSSDSIAPNVPQSEQQQQTSKTTPPKIRESKQPKSQAGSTSQAKNAPPNSPDGTTIAKTGSKSSPTTIEPKSSQASLAHRLPPKFTAVDPDETFSAKAPTEEHKIILPDGEGGFQRIDSRVVHVERDGKKVQLYSAPKEKKEHRRFVQNIMAILIGIVILAATFYLLINW